MGGVAVGPSAILDSLQVFDWYDGGGIDVACLSFGEVDRLGNVNVARFGGMMPGSGGFINIVHAARKLVFCGTLTAKGSDGGEPGRPPDRAGGAIRRFVPDVELVTFNGETAVKKGQEAVYVTERAVFRRERDGMVLSEVAPGSTSGRTCWPTSIPGSSEPGAAADSRRPVRGRMTPAGRGSGSGGATRPAGREAGRSVAMETDARVSRAPTSRSRSPAAAGPGSGASPGHRPRC